MLGVFFAEQQLSKLSRADMAATKMRGKYSKKRKNKEKY
jgi:hypothetical protein